MGAHTGNLSVLGVGKHRYIVQAVELINQHGVGLELISKLHYRDVRYDAG